MNTLRKRPLYDDVIKSINNPPVFKYKEPEGIKILNDIIIPNLLFDNVMNDDTMIEEMKNEILFDKYTQTPYVKSTQTDVLNKETQKPYELQDYDLHPHLYYKIDAMSKYMKNDKTIKSKNDGFAGIISKSKNTYESIIQTSNYIPSSYKEKSDNINQTVRYMLKQIKTQDETEGDYTQWYSSLNKNPSQESLPPVGTGNNPGFIRRLFISTTPPQQQSISSLPSVPSATIPSSPSGSPPASEIELTPQQIRERSRSRDSIQSDKDKSKK